jgi:hypothetical protein
MTGDPLQAGRVFGRTAGIFLLHLLAASFGPAAFESLLWSVIGQPRSLAVLESREWILSIGSAAAIAYVLCKKWPTASALWVWTVPAAVLLFRVVLYTTSPHPADATVLQHFLRPDCSQDVSQCQDFLLATVLSIRAAAYSVAAWAVLKFGTVGKPAHNLNGPTTKKR